MNQVSVLLAGITLVFAVALLGARLATRSRAAVRHLTLAAAFGVVLVLPLAMRLSPTITVEVAGLPERDAPAAMPGDGGAEAVDSPATTPDAMQSDPVPAWTAPARPAERVTAHTMPAPLRHATILHWQAATGWQMAWALVAMASFMPVLIGLAHLRRVRRQADAWKEGGDRVRRLAQDGGIRPPPVLLHDGVAAPITSGWLRPAIILPPEVATWTPVELDNALVHELEHIRRRDWLVQCLARATCALLWFHPLAWMAWRALRLEAERACDDAVLARADAVAYAQQLLGLARDLSGRPSLPAVPMASGSLAARIRSLLDHAHPRGRAGKGAVAAIVIAAAFVVAALAPLRVAGPVREAAGEGRATRGLIPAAAAAEGTRRTAPARPTVPSPGPHPVPVARNDAARPPALDDSTGGFSLHRIAGPVTIDGRRWITADPVVGNRKVTSPNGRFTVSLANPQAEGDVERYRLVYTETGGRPVSLAADTVAYALVSPDSRWIFLEPLDVVDVETWRRYPLSKLFDIHSYVVPQAISADGRHMTFLRTDCAADCRNVPREYYELTFPGAEPDPALTAGIAATPRAVVAEVLELVRSAATQITTRGLDEATRPINGLQHLDRYAQGILDNDGSDPEGLAAGYIEVINALINTANGAENVAGRPRAGLSPPALRQLAADMRRKSAELVGLLMPAFDVRPGDDSPAHQPAIAALQVARRARGDPLLARAWLDTELRTLERAAQSVASDDGAAPEATALKQGLFRRSLQTTMNQASQISSREDLDPEARRRAAALVQSLRDVGRVEALPGRGGHQVSFSVPGMEIEQASISGDNQYDRHVTWDSARFGVTCTAGRCDEVRTGNWWFKGKVTVEYRLRGDRNTYSCHSYVDEQPTDSYWVALMAPEVRGADGRCRSVGGR